MKSIMNTLLALACTLSLQAQFSRAVYPTPTSGRMRSASITSVNGDTYFLSLKESPSDTLRIVTGRIDEFGDTDNYRQMDVTGLSFVNVNLSGMGSDASGELVCAILTNYSGLGYLHYIRINPLTGTAQVDYTMPYDFEGPFAPTRVKGDSLITYITEENVGLVRIAASISNPANHSREIVDPTVTITGTLGGNFRHLDTKIEDNGNEFVVTQGNLYKRNTNGSFATVPVTNFGPNELQGLTLGVNSNGEILVVNPVKFARFNAALAFANNGSLNLPNQSGTRFFEVVADGASWQFFVDNNMDEFVRSTFSSNMTLLQEDRIDRFNLALDLVPVAGIHYLLLERHVTHPVFNSFKFLGLIGLENSNVEPFIEYGQNITHNNLKIAVSHLGQDFSPKYFSVVNNDPGIQYEHGGIERTVLFYSSDYIVGEDLNQDVYSNYYDNWSNANYPGPYSPNSLESIELGDKYSRGYYVDRDMIENHLYMISSGNSNYTIPFGIREWPAHGDVGVGQAADLAPFFDQNSNGTYEPELGDYPLIYGSRCILNMYHGNPTNNASGLEFHQYIYTFDCDTSELLNSSVFVTSQMFAREGDFTNAYFMKFSDGDIGNSGDDFGGTNVELGMTYTYNGDLNDEAFGQYYQFNDTLPALGYQILKGVKIANDGIDNNGTAGFPVNAYGLLDGTIDNEYTTMESSLLNPYSVWISQLNAYYNVAQGKLPDGTPNTENGVEVRFDFFGDSDPTFYASNGANHGNAYFEQFSGSIPSERSIWGNSGKFDLTPQTSVEITGAYIVAIDTLSATIDISQPVKKLFAMGTALKDQFGNNEAGCGLSFEPYVSSETISLVELMTDMDVRLYPNPTSDRFIAEYLGAASCHLVLTDLQGNILLEKDFNQQTSVSLEGISSGLYMVNFSSGDQRISKRIVKL